MNESCGFAVDLLWILDEFHMKCICFMEMFIVILAVPIRQPRFSSLSVVISAGSGSGRSHDGELTWKSHGF